MRLETKSQHQSQVHAAQSLRFLFAMPSCDGKLTGHVTSISRVQRVNSSNTAGSWSKSSIVPSRLGCLFFANRFIDGCGILRVHSESPFLSCSNGIAKLAGGTLRHTNTAQGEPAAVLFFARVRA